MRWVGETPTLPGDGGGVACDDKGIFEDVGDAFKAFVCGGKSPGKDSVFKLKDCE
jgi:hypothetical protein